MLQPRKQTDFISDFPNLKLGVAQKLKRVSHDAKSRCFRRKSPMASPNKTGDAFFFHNALLSQGNELCGVGQPNCKFPQNSVKNI